MSIVGLFDAEVSIYRIGKTKTRLGAVGTVPVIVQNEVRATIQLQRVTARDEGVGSRPIGTALMFIEADADLKDEDVILVVDGPNLGTWWSVSGIFEPSRGRYHKEVNLKPYIGERPSG